MIEIKNINQLKELLSDNDAMYKFNCKIKNKTRVGLIEEYLGMKFLRSGEDGLCFYPINFDLSLDKNLITDLFICRI